MWASETESLERFRDETCERKPAEPGGTRFETGMFEDGMEETPFWLDFIDDTGTVYDRHFFSTQGEVWDMVEGFRDSEARRAEADRLGVHPLEIEFAPFGPAWQREQEQR